MLGVLNIRSGESETEKKKTTFVFFISTILSSGGNRDGGGAFYPWSVQYHNSPNIGSAGENVNVDQRWTVRKKKLALKIIPAIVVPVFVNPGPLTPFLSKTSLRLQRSKLNPPASMLF